MVSQDSEIKNYLKTITNDLKRWEKDILSVEIVINKIKEKITFTKEGIVDASKFTPKIKKQCLNVLRGGFISRVYPKVKKIGEKEEALKNNLESLNQYLLSGDPKKRAGNFSEVMEYWKENKKKIATYRAAIVANFSWGNTEAILYTALNESNLNELSRDYLETVERQVAGFLVIVRELKEKVNFYWSNYKDGGIEAVTPKS